MNLLLLCALQVADPWVISPPAPTVGDTVVIERTVELSADGRLRAQPLGQSLLVEPLGDPLVQRVARGVLVQYTLALFEPGRHAVEMPATEVLYRDGRVDQLPADTAWIRVAAVLPPGDSLPPPRASLAPLARFPTRTVPLALFVGLVVAGGGAWAVARRRRLRGTPESRRATRPAVPPVARWISAGEARAVATVASERVRERIMQLEPRADRALSAEECIALLEDARPDWPLRSLSDVLRDLERARFAPAVASDVSALVAHADAVLVDLGRAAGSP